MKELKVKQVLQRVAQDYQKLLEGLQNLLTFTCSKSNVLVFLQNALFSSLSIVDFEQVNSG